MPWNVTGDAVTPDTNMYISTSLEDGLTFVGDGGAPVDVALYFADANQPVSAILGFANGGANAFMESVGVGDVVLKANPGRVGLGSGPATTSPRVLICNDTNSPPSGEDGTVHQAGGLWLFGQLRFTSEFLSYTGEYINSPRTLSDPNGFGLEFYTNDTLRMAITNGGNVGIGTQTPSAALDVTGDIRVSGDVVLANGADCAEDFAAESTDIGPGTVVVLSDDSTLRESCQGYDCRVAGVVSGAGDLRPGLRLNHQDNRDSYHVPVALIGRVACKVDAGPEPIAVGDLLTTADTPGHAMKATDRDRAFGAILGKAMAPLDSGRGLIPVLVALQ
jgi:hypothetical protein